MKKNATPFTQSYDDFSEGCHKGLMDILRKILGGGALQSGEEGF